MQNPLKHTNTRGFTITELLIVIVVIAVLAIIVVVSYERVTLSSETSSIESSLKQTASSLQITRTQTGAYPTSLPSDTLQKDNVRLIYTQSSSTSYCLSGASTGSSGIALRITESKKIETGLCPGHTL